MEKDISALREAVEEELYPLGVITYLICEWAPEGNPTREVPLRDDIVTLLGYTLKGIRGRILEHFFRFEKEGGEN
ncbi:MAG TPA: hypothetical protein EYP59_15520 [Thiotrichaceae bacterium]|nr:hypothetical protein [Thiotrichaceae bacterium]